MVERFQIRELARVHDASSVEQPLDLARRVGERGPEVPIQVLGARDAEAALQAEELRAWLGKKRRSR